MIGRKRIENIVADFSNDYSLIKKMRTLGALEGILLCYGKLESGKPFGYENKTVQKNFLWLKWQIVVSETYEHLILRKTRELISELEKQEA